MYIDTLQYPFNRVDAFRNLNGSTGSTPPSCKEYMRELHHLGSVPIVIQQMNQFPQDVSCRCFSTFQILSAPTIFGYFWGFEIENARIKVAKNGHFAINHL